MDNDEPKNIKFYSKNIENDLNEPKIEYTWEFTLDNQNISIIYIHNLKINKRKILFNQSLIKEEIFDGNKYTYEFYEKDHFFKIVHKNDEPELYIDSKYFKSFNSFQKMNVEVISIQFFLILIFLKFLKFLNFLTFMKLVVVVIVMMKIMMVMRYLS